MDFTPILIICFSALSGVTDAVVSVEASFNDTRCDDGGMVCSDDPLLFNCTVTGSTVDRAIITLLSDVEVAVRDDNLIRGQESLPVGITVFDHSAVVNNNATDYVLILLIEAASLLNDRQVECSSLSAMQEKLCPVATDLPGPPQGLSQDTSANTVSSVVVEWESPSFTGGSGISITSYNVTIDGSLSGTVISDDGSGLYTHNITGLDYNTDYSVEVATVNECGLTSQPATITVNIEAREPPVPTLVSTELSCNVSLNEGRPVTIAWQFGDNIADVIYPGDMNVNVDFDPSIINDCSGPIMSCTVNLTNPDQDKYYVNLTLRNDVGSTMPVFAVFNSTIMSAEENLDEENSPSVRIFINSNCSVAMYLVKVGFGVLKEDDEIKCIPETNTSEMPLSPGGSYDFKVEGIERESGERHCYIAYFNSGVEVIRGVGKPFDESETDPPSIIGPAVGGGVAGVVLIIIGTVLLIVGIYCICCRNKNSNQNDQEMKHLSSSSGAASPVAKDPSSAEAGEGGPTYQAPSSITRSPHPTTGELYTDVNLDKKREHIEHEMGPGGEMYAMPQKKGKKGKKKEGEGEGEKQELTEEEKAALYSVPDRKGQKAKSEGLTYADLDIHSSTKPPPSSKGSQYVDVKHN